MLAFREKVLYYEKSLPAKKMEETEVTIRFYVQ